MKESKIAALREMAARGTPYEQQTAREILKKNNIPESPPPDNKETWLSLDYRTAFEKKLIFQTYFSIFRKSREVEYYRNGNKSIEILVKDSGQLKHFSDKVAAVLVDWRRKLAAFQEAYISRNHLYGDETSEDTIQEPIKRKPDEPSLNEVVAIMRGLTELSFEFEDEKLRLRRG